MLCSIGSNSVWFGHNNWLFACVIVDSNIGFDAKLLFIVWLDVIPLIVIKKYAIFAGWLMQIKPS